MNFSAVSDVIKIRSMVQMALTVYKHKHKTVAFKAPGRSK